MNKILLSFVFGLHVYECVFVVICACVCSQQIQFTYRQCLSLRVDCMYVSRTSYVICNGPNQLTKHCAPQDMSWSHILREPNNTNQLKAYEVCACVSVRLEAKAACDYFAKTLHICIEYNTFIYLENSLKCNSHWHFHRCYYANEEVMVFQL